MKAPKPLFTSVRKHRVREAHRHVCDTLREIKAYELSGQNLQRMKSLEAAAQHLENVLI